MLLFIFSFLDRKGSLAGHNLPGLASGSSIPYQEGLGMKSNGRTNVPWDCEEGITNREVSRIWCLDHEMLLTLQEGLGPGQLGEPCPLFNVAFGGHCLVTQVQAKSSVRLADDPGEQHGGAHELKVRKGMAITRIPKQRSSRAALPIFHLGKQSEGGTSADHDGWRGKVFVFQ